MRILGPILILLALFTLAGCERETPCEKAVREYSVEACRTEKGLCKDDWRYELWRSKTVLKCESGYRIES